MPSRKIPRSASSITGRCYSMVAGAQVGHESGLERDLIIAADFLDAASGIESQPVKISIESKSYHPDFLLEFNGEPSERRHPSILVEVKYQKDLLKHEEKLRPSFELGQVYAQAHGWLFKVLTEQEIRADPISILRFLRAQLRFTPDQHLNPIVEETLHRGPKPLWEVATKVGNQGSSTIPKAWHAIWCMLSARKLTLQHPILKLDTLVMLSRHAEENSWTPGRLLGKALQAAWEVRP